MKRIDTVIIGGGQAGLAMSRSLTARGVEHVVLERGRVGERWRSERWDSLRMLTPNWQSRLPGWSYRGGDRDGYMTMPEVVRYLEDYARASAAPVEDRTTVRSVSAVDGGYVVATDRGSWRALNVVVATGATDTPNVPAAARALPADIDQVVPSAYRNPDGLAPGGVLVVGAAASGVQIADELRRAGRDVVLAAGRHTRLPRTYRGRDIMWWIDTLGIFDDRVASVPNIDSARRTPSFQLVGRPDRRSIDLGTLARLGVRIAGRLADVSGPVVGFAGDLPLTMEASHAKMTGLLDRIDRFVRRAGLEREVAAPDRPARLAVPASIDSLDLRAEGVRTVLWATGYRRRYPWLHVPVLDARGEIAHDGGVTAARGLYVLGMRFLRRRNSNFLDGVGLDAVELADHLARLGNGRRAAA